MLNRCVQRQGLLHSCAVGGAGAVLQLQMLVPGLFFHLGVFCGTCGIVCLHLPDLVCNERLDLL